MLFFLGYSLDGKKVKKALDLSDITKLLTDADDPDAWKTITDIKNQRTFKLSPTDIEVGVSVFVYWFMGLTVLRLEKL